jgi:hypothetical protein
MAEACSFEGCDRPRVGRGLCMAHYRQQRRGAPLHPIGTPGFKPGRRTPPTCLFEGCGRPNNGGGLCAAHRWQERHKGKLVPVGAAKRWWFLTPLGEAALPSADDRERRDA